MMFSWVRLAYLRGAVRCCLVVALLAPIMVSCAEGRDATPAAIETVIETVAAVATEDATPHATDGLTVADGYIADGESVSPFALDLPAVSNLNPTLLARIQRAHQRAAHDDIEIMITSGWRSERYQQALLDEAIIRYGSNHEARRWVNTPDASTHVTGQAIDIGPTEAISWLSQRSDEYGLCQTYANEPWHYELAAEDGSCPRQLDDAATK